MKALAQNRLIIAAASPSPLPSQLHFLSLGTDGLSEVDLDLSWDALVARFPSMREVRSARIRVHAADVASPLFPLPPLIAPLLPLCTQKVSVVTEVLEPGETLFLPNGWWHHVTSLDNPTISVSCSRWLPMFHAVLSCCAQMLLSLLSPFPPECIQNIDRA